MTFDEFKGTLIWPVIVLACSPLILLFMAACLVVELIDLAVIWVRDGK